MNVVTYAFFSYALTAIISIVLIAVLVSLDKLIGGGQEEQNNG